MWTYKQNIINYYTRSKRYYVRITRNHYVYTEISMIHPTKNLTPHVLFPPTAPEHFNPNNTKIYIIIN